MNKNGGKGNQNGVDTILGNSCSEVAFNRAKETFNNRAGLIGVPSADECSGFFSQVIMFGNTRIAVSSDGIGTKAEVAERQGVYDTLGYDLMAMIADDLSSIGAVPTTISNIIDADHLDVKIIDELMKGLNNAAKTAGVVISGGEIAELGDRICGYGKGMHFNWCATGIGIIPEGKEPIDGSEVKPGQSVVTFYNPGFRSNGFTLARKILHREFGDNWHEKPYSDKLTWGEALLTASKIYSPVITNLIDSGVKITGIAHITGGGVIDNFRRTLRRKGLGALLDNLFEPDDYVKKLQMIGKIPEETAYSQWNMGNGMLVIVNGRDVDTVVQCAARSGISARQCGIISNEPLVTVHTKGANPQIITG